MCIFLNHGRSTFRGIWRLTELSYDMLQTVCCAAISWSLWTSSLIMRRRRNSRAGFRRSPKSRRGCVPDICRSPRLRRMNSSKSISETNAQSSYAYVTLVNISQSFRFFRSEFRRILNCCWPESTIVLQFYCGCLQ